MDKLELAFQMINIIMVVSIYQVLSMCHAVCKNFCMHYPIKPS